jgi:predicted nucleic acid-binding Zn ribbon protein
LKQSQPHHIGKGIASVLRELGLGTKIKSYEVLDAWPRIVGTQIASVSTAERIESGKLFIHVTRSAWRNELVFLKSALIMKINKDMEQEVVKDIIFR